MNKSRNPGSGDATRRGMLCCAGGLVLSVLTGAAGARGRTAQIVQPAQAGPEEFMQRAIEMRRRAVESGDQPFGAIIVCDGRIVGEGVSAVITGSDPTAHAEIQAIRDAARRLGSRDLSGCEMYGTSRACPMCEAGAYWARLARLHYGASIVDAGAPRLC